jgi:hypothetical protein
MPLRKLAVIPFIVREQEQPPVAAEHANLWRTALLLVTSAACGGIAVAIWNRRTLAQIRQQTDPDPASRER